MNHAQGEAVGERVSEERAKFLTAETAKILSSTDY